MLEAIQALPLAEQFIYGAIVLGFTAYTYCEHKRVNKHDEAVERYDPAVIGKVLSVIRSCKTTRQIEVAERMMWQAKVNRAITADDADYAREVLINMRDVNAVTGECK